MTEAAFALFFGVLGWVGSIIAIARFQAFIRLLAAFADLASIYPILPFPARTFGVTTIVFGLVWGGFMILFGVVGLIAGRG